MSLGPLSLGARVIKLFWYRAFIALCVHAGLLFEQFDKFWIAKEPESVMAFNVVREEFKQSLQAMLRTSCSLSLPVEQLTRR